MTDKQVDMFKLVEEVEKQKGMKNIDDIFSDLDSVKIETGETADVYHHDQRSYMDTVDQKMISRPVLPSEIGYYDSRFSAFKALIENVSYGTNQLNVYVEGHQEALTKYFQDAYNNAQDLYVVEARVNDEISRNTSHATLYEKGYYDGLVYIMKALRRSKELAMVKIDEQIRKKL